MAFSLPSLVSRHILRPGKQASQQHLRQLFPYSASFTTSLKAPSLQFQYGLHTLPSAVVRKVKNTGLKETRGLSFLLKGATVAGVGLGLATLQKPPIHCDPPEPKPTTTTPPIYPEDRGPLPESSVSLYELGFGTVAGLCAGVFVKKGSKAVAWFLGGIFVLLQYLGSASLVRVDWKRMAGKFENLFYTKDATGATRPPNVLSLWNWLIDFLTADFQPRASFIAGFALGLRVG
ncbi:FUN14 family-domain-containing protein [Flammula alnicola]|nr:FUN14 family-domain-containing protein [Flammula alnicola]